MEGFVQVDVEEMLYRRGYNHPVQHGIENPAHAFISGMEEDDDIIPGLLARKARKVYPD